MSDYKKILISLAWRLIGALPFFIISIYTLASVEGGYLWGFSQACFGLLMLMAGVAILTPPLTQLFVEPLDLLFSPGRRFTKPQPIYSIPEAKVKQGRHEEAWSLYEEIIEKHPERLKPYVKMIDIAIVHLKDWERATAIYQRGMAALPKQKDRETLTKLYKAMSTRLQSELGGDSLRSPPSDARPHFIGIDVLSFDSLVSLVRSGHFNSLTETI